MNTGAVAGIVVGGVAVLSPLGDLPIKLYLFATPFAHATDPYACWQLLNRVSSPSGGLNPCFGLRQQDFLGLAFGRGGIDLAVIFIGLALIAWGLYKERDHIKEFFGRG
jgi:hypothetical protein